MTGVRKHVEFAHLPPEEYLRAVARKQYELNKAQLKRYHATKIPSDRPRGRPRKEVVDPPVKNPVGRPRKPFKNTFPVEVKNDDRDSERLERERTPCSI